MQRPVVVGLDGSGTSASATRVAAEEAWALTVPLRVVHAWLVTDPGLPTATLPRLDEATEQQLAKALREQVVATLGESGADGVEERVAYGYPGRVLADASREAALVMVGSRGLGALRSALLGLHLAVRPRARLPAR